MEQDNRKEVYLKERYHLAMERIHGICTEETVSAPFCIYFKKTAQFLLLMEEVKNAIENGETELYTLQQWQELNVSLYFDIFPGQYDTSYGNPAYAAAVLGKTYGKLLSFLYAELRGLIVYVFEQRLEEIVILLELFIEVYNCFEQEELPKRREIQQIIYWFVSDYSELFVARRIQENLDPELDFAARIIMDSDLNDLRLSLIHI